MIPATAVIPVHNRREITLRCLRHLEATGVLAWASVVIVDDGSIDSTASAVRESFPAVTILPGDGNLWWGGAIRLGMDHAMRAGAGFIIWLNDDCLPDPGTLELLVDHASRTGGVAAGWAVTPSGGRYGASRKTWRGLKEVDVPKPGGAAAADAAAGNCVVFSRAVVEAIGLPDAARLHHALLDVDYTLTATGHGFPLDLIGSAVCRNADNLQPAAASWMLSEQSPMLQWKLFLRPHSTYGYRASFRLHWKHWGILGLPLYLRGYVKLALVCLLRALVPLRILQRVFASRSISWQRQQFYRDKACGVPPAPSGKQAGGGMAPG
jgi:glycosyltransferase involved in cell wall biosynthesis